jgi:hypothetical protein
MVRSPNRHNIDFETCFNFRDLGGYAGLHNRTVRRGRVFRSMTPEYMNEADARRTRDLNIGLVIDFRGDRYETSGPISEPPARRITAAPVFLHDMANLPPDVAALMAAPPEDALPRLLNAYAGAFAEALTAMCAEPGANVLFHCRLGKDRTGVFAALLLKLLRVSDTDVIEDYMLTAQAEPQMKQMLAGLEDPITSREPRVAREPVERRAIECVLQRLESQFGTAYNYFLRLGVASANLDALIESLLEAPSEYADAPDRISLPLAALSHN